jgi:tRNA threonylcarbamoyl adenosine modification protein YjeE
MAGAAEAHVLTLALPEEAATERLGADLAAILVPGDVVAIAGDLGAGKSTLARAIVRALAGKSDLEVPSPTFMLLQSYDTPHGQVVHTDLYRLDDPSELEEIGWDDLGGMPIVLIEWPERAEGRLPADRFQVQLGPAAADAQGRTATIEGFGAAAARLARATALWRFLAEAGWGAAERRHIQGDASSRRYERLRLGEASAILMDAPRRPDGPAIQGGRSYSAIARLAEDVRPFAAMAQGLSARGFSAPAILAADLAQGFLLLEDFGDQTVLRVGAPAIERMTVAVDVLLRLHGLDLPGELAVGDGTVHRPGRYDAEPMLIELELLLDWYLPTRGRGLPASERSGFLELWRAALAPAWAAAPTWTLRDYHSPNLMWLPEREGIARIGLLDFQDAVLGHPAYDLVSLLQDARTDIPEALELHLLSRYVGGRQMSDVEFEPAAFAASYAALGAQRASKILGIFVRLAERDGKPGYLRHLPRVYGYLMRDLAHPAMAPLAAWYARHVAPPPADG